MRVILAALIAVCLISCGPTYQGTVDVETLTLQNAAANIQLARAALALDARLRVLEGKIAALDGGIGTILEWIRIYEQQKVRQGSAPGP